MEYRALLSAVSAVSVLLVLLSKLIRSSLLVQKPKLNLPPGPWTLPVIGSLHHLVSSPSIHRAMHALAQKHGPLMSLRLGELPAVVASTPEAAQEFMKTHDITFAERHMSTTFSALAFDGNDILFAPYGERWRQLRKICVLELLSVARVQSFRRIREEEVSRLLGNVAAAGAAGATVNMTKMITALVNDTVVRESVGARTRHRDDYMDALDTAIRQLSGLAVADLFPSSRLMRLVGRAPGKVMACRNRIQRILEQVIQEAREAMDGGDARIGCDGFVGVLLKLQKERSMPIPLDDDTIVAVMFDMFSAGSETSSTTLNWCMTELVRNPKVMAKVQAEVREAFKGKSTVTEGDLHGLSYLKLVIRETLRLHTPAPLPVPRKCREKCQIMGYDVPKGTLVFVNVWTISRDPKYWVDPEEFKPERFENSKLDYMGTNFEYIPFGAGRRNCPGINLGLANIELALASLLYHFDWKLPDGIEPKDVDVREAAGFIASKKTGLIVHPVTRIPPVYA